MSRTRSGRTVPASDLRPAQSLTDGAGNGNAQRRGIGALGRELAWFPQSIAGSSEYYTLAENTRLSTGELRFFYHIIPAELGLHWKSCDCRVQ